MTLIGRQLHSALLVAVSSSKLKRRNDLTSQLTPDYEETVSGLLRKIPLLHCFVLLSSFKFAFQHHLQRSHFSARRLPRIHMAESTEEIRSLCLSCEREFQFLCGSLNTNNNRVLPSTKVEDELARFKIWATNIGAANIGRASLDYRLRDAEYLQEDVMSLLEDLEENIHQG